MAEYTCIKGPCAATITLLLNKKEYKLTLDWSYDSYYYKFEDESWITLSYGPKGKENEIENEIEKINTEKKKEIFQKLCEYSYRDITDSQAYECIQKLKLLKI